MRLDWLEDILAIIETGSLGEAANSRYLTQPAFSRRVQTIEALLGVELVDRTRRPARPADGLKENEQRIRELSADLRALIADLKTEGRRKGNTIVLASQHAITTSHAPAIVRDMARLGQTRARLRSANRAECHALLLTRQADLILTYRTDDEPSLPGADFAEELRLASEALIPVATAQVANQPADGDLPVIAYPADVFLGQLFNAQILPKIEAVADIRPAAETALTLAALQLAKVGLAVAWIPASLAAADIANGGLVDLSGRLPTATMQLIATRLSGAKSELEEKVWRILAERVG